MSPRARLALHWAPALATMGVIWLLSSMSNPPVDVSSLPFRDRGAHFLSFGSVAFWVAHGTMATVPGAHALRVVFFAVLSAALWGLLDEIHLAISPVLLGRGEHLLQGIDTVSLGYRCTEHVATRRATHVVLSR